MSNININMKKKKNIALIAHDERKQDLLEWADYNKGTLSKHNLFGTGTTGSLIARETKLKVKTFKSGPLGGDQQIGAMIAEGEIDFLIRSFGTYRSHVIELLRTLWFLLT